MILRLMHEINELRYELERLKAEDAMLIESLNNRVRELEMELNELKQIAESTQIVSARAPAGCRHVFQDGGLFSGERDAAHDDEGRRAEDGCDRATHGDGE